MNPAKVLARLNPKTQDFGGIPGGSANDAMFHAHLTKGIERKHLAAGMIKWGRNFSDEPYLERALYVRSAGIATEKKWKLIPGKPMIRSMCHLAITEMAYGLPHSPDNERDRRPTLRIQIINDYAKEDIMSKQNWSQRWSDRYELIFNILNAWAQISYDQINHNQRG